MIIALSACKEKPTFSSLPGITGNSGALITQDFDSAQIKRGEAVYLGNWLPRPQRSWHT